MTSHTPPNLPHRLPRSPAVQPPIPTPTPLSSPPPLMSSAPQPRRSQRIKSINTMTATQLPTKTNTRLPDTVSINQPTTANQTRVCPTDQVSDVTGTQTRGHHDDHPDNGDPTNTPKTKRKRRRNILYYNPPYSSSLTTKFGKLFLQLIDKHFPITHPLYPVMNRKKVKISFSICPSMKLIINSHNRKVLQKLQTPTPVPPCNCVKNCPLPDGGCRTKAVI